jgi:hypothetical protein
MLTWDIGCAALNSQLRLPANSRCSVSDARKMFAAFSIVKTKTPVQGALGGIKFVIYARVPS